MPGYTSDSMGVIARTLVQELGPPIGLKKYGYSRTRYGPEGGFVELGFKDNMNLMLDVVAGEVKFGVTVPTSLPPKLVRQLSDIHTPDNDQMGFVISSKNDAEMPAFIERIRGLIADVF